MSIIVILGHWTLSLSPGQTNIVQKVKLSNLYTKGNFRKSTQKDSKTLSILAINKKLINMLSNNNLIYTNKLLLISVYIYKFLFPISFNLIYLKFKWHFKQEN